MKKTLVIIITVIIVLMLVLFFIPIRIYKYNGPSSPVSCDIMEYESGYNIYGIRLYKKINKWEEK